MHQLIRAGALCVLLALLAWQQSPIQAEPKEGDWKDGWNTWADTKKGEWAEYAMEGGIKVRWEAVKVEGKKVTYKRSSYAKDKLTGEQELTRAWDAIKLQSKLPYGKDVVITWTEQDLVLAGVTLKCEVAEWTIGAASSAVYYCKDVPCGGVVKTVTNGKDIVWLCGFFKDGAAEVKADPVKEVVSQMPRFYANNGNFLVVKLSGTGRDESYQLRTVTDAAETSAKLTVVACDKEGTPDANAKSTESKLTKESWEKDYGKPSESGVKLTVGGGEYVCDVYRKNADGREITEWVSEGAMLKKVIKTKSGETVLEAVRLEMK